MKYTDKKFLEKIINKYSNSSNKENNYPLTSSPFETSDIIKGAETLIGGRITMSKITLTGDNIILDKSKTLSGQQCVNYSRNERVENIEKQQIKQT